MKNKYQIGDTVITYQSGVREQGSIQDLWYDEHSEYRYLVKLGRHQQLWSIGESWLKPQFEKKQPSRDNT